MDSRDSFPTVADWKKTLWIGVSGAVVIAILLLGLSALMRVIYLVGILYGLVLVFLAFYAAKLAIRVEYGEPADPIDEENALVFPFRDAAQYPQLLLLLFLALGTMMLSPMVAYLTGNIHFSEAEDSSKGGHVADPRQPRSHLPNIPPPNQGRKLPENFSPGNVQVAGVTTSSDWVGRHVGRLAFDQDISTYWNSGTAPPGWIEADLGKPTQLKELRMCLYTFPDTNAIHEVWISDNPMGEGLAGGRKVHTFDQFVRQKDLLSHSFPEGTVARHIQIRTTKSASWPSWFEIAMDAR